MPALQAVTSFALPQAPAPRLVFLMSRETAYSKHCLLVIMNKRICRVYQSFLGVKWKIFTKYSKAENAVCYSLNKKQPGNIYSSFYGKIRNAICRTLVSSSILSRLSSSDSTWHFGLIFFKKAIKIDLLSIMF